jgi:hypothetical protein
MLIITIILIILAIRSLIVGAPFFDTRCKMYDIGIAISESREVTRDAITMVLKGTGIILLAVCLTIFDLFYLGYAYGYDVLQYPTVAWIVYEVGSIVYISCKGTKGEGDAKTRCIIEKSKLHRWTLGYIIREQLWLLYLIYIAIEVIR